MKPRLHIANGILVHYFFVYDNRFYNKLIRMYGLNLWLYEVH